MPATVLRAPDEHMRLASSAPFLIAHLLPLAAIFTGVRLSWVLLGVALYVGRMFCITAGYHRYFAHRSYRLGRVTQFLLAFGGLTAAQKGPLWWASTHRDHHRFTDTDRDPHSPQKGFWWSHVGWILSGKETGGHDRIKDFAKYPELRFLDKHDWIGPWTLGVVCYLVAGWGGLVVGFFTSTVLLWHATFSVNSLSHTFGWRRFGTDDTSRNSVLVALLTMGEGWHNNHHHCPASARQGFRWWEVDITYYALQGLRLVGVTKDLRPPPASVRSSRQLRRGALDVGMLRLHLARASAVVHRSGARDHEGERLIATLGRLAQDAKELTRTGATPPLAD
jgi:stearoyl-CoA desaturase (delta-9 desaturase)